ncbi:hypothetical protein J132_09344 [Termitomyces sp. J132]|nr:hypothetical protein J132_09344 [Termitomyces sp. J132]
MSSTQPFLSATMALNLSIPTTPCRTPTGPAARLPHATSSAQPSPPQSSSDHFGLLKLSVKHDTHQVILAILQFPTFTQAIISMCRIASSFNGSRADCAQYLGTMQLCFANQANFPHITEQKGLFDSLSDILPILDHGATSNSANVESFLTFADTITQIKKNCCEAQRKYKAKEKHHAKD